MKIFITVAIAAFASICHAGGASPSLYGLKINSPIEYPECEKKQNYTGPELLSYKRTFSSTPSCFKKTSDIGRTVHIEGIIISRNNEFDVILRNSSIDRISFWTYGHEDQDEVFQKLSSKFGRPRKLTRPRVQNKFGATFRVIEAEWRIDSATLTFNTNTGSLESGLVELLSREASDEIRLDRKNPARDEKL